MPSVVHVVTTANFAGVERYVSEVARETSYRGWRVATTGPRCTGRAATAKASATVMWA